MMGVEILNASQEQCQKFEQYLSLLLKWNSKYNLTAIRDPESIVKRHFVESASMVGYLGDAKSLLDLGTGAGLPGIPIAIMRPNIQVTLLESNAKKATFCREVLRVCGLTNVRVVCGRAEDATMLCLGFFDVVISRAVWSLKDYLPLACRFVEPMAGRIIALKGPRYVEELAETDPSLLQLRPPEVIEVSTGGELEPKQVVLIFRRN